MSSLSLEASGAARAAIAAHLDALVADSVASRIAAKDSTLWGPDAESEAAIRLGWVALAETSRPLLEPISKLRQELVSEGVVHIVLAGMGGSSLAPEVIAATEGVELTVLDSTDPEQVRAALSDRLPQTALVVSSKSGTTLETDSALRVFTQAFTEAGLDAASRIVVVTDPGSPLEAAGREAGYRAVFTADPNVGGRYSALTAFGLVPTGLAGVDIAALLDEAEEAAETVRDDAEDNIALRLGAALAGTKPLRDKILIVDDGSGLHGFGDWAEQLIAESTGKQGTGVLPVVVPAPGPERAAHDELVVRLLPTDSDTVAAGDEVTISGGLAGQMLVWETATAVAGRLLGINPFDQPDVEAAKKAARGLLDDRPDPSEPDFVDGAVEVRVPTTGPGTDDGRADVGQGDGGQGDGGQGDGEKTLVGALNSLVSRLGPDGYLSVQAYLDRITHAPLSDIAASLTDITARPVTFGWGPRFLHSTGQFHKGGPAVGVYLQITAAPGADLPIPERPFTFGELIAAQAAGDASVLADHGRPVLRLHLRDREAGIAALRRAVADLARLGEQ